MLDPKCLSKLLEASRRPVLHLIADLKDIEPPVSIGLLYPDYLADADEQPVVSEIRPLLKLIPESERPLAFTLKDRVPEEHRARLIQDTQEARRAVALLALSQVALADGIVTENEAAVAARYPLLQHHRIRIIPLEEFADVVEVCAHGHLIFCSASSPLRPYSPGLTSDVFYQRTHWKNRRLATWFFRVGTRYATELRENLRNALLNRYSFLLFSRDMVWFYQIQLDHFARRKLLRRFSALLNYHLTNFYMHVWGMLEHLSVIAKHALELGIEERACGIRSPEFWMELGQKRRGLRDFIESPKVQDWIGTMGDMRHAAAHRAMHLATALVVETEDSKKSDTEIADILRREEPEFYRLMPEELVRALDPQRIWHWRMRKMEVLGDNIVVVARKSGQYIRAAVESVDYDLAILDAVVDAFLVGVLGWPEAVAN